MNVSVNFLELQKNSTRSEEQTEAQACPLRLKVLTLSERSAVISSCLSPLLLQCLETKQTEDNPEETLNQAQVLVSSEVSTFEQHAQTQ